jgi:hypothetical protein
MNWANEIPVTVLVGLAFAAGGLVATLRLVWVGQTLQGKRVGELEHWRLACETIEKERARVRADTHGIPARSDER